MCCIVASRADIRWGYIVNSGIGSNTSSFPLDSASESRHDIGGFLMQWWGPLLKIDNNREVKPEHKFLCTILGISNLFIGVSKICIFIISLKMPASKHVQKILVNCNRSLKRYLSLDTVPLSKICSRRHFQRRHFFVFLFPVHSFHFL